MYTNSLCSWFSPLKLCTCPDPLCTCVPSAFWIHTCQGFSTGQHSRPLVNKRQGRDYDLMRSVKVAFSYLMASCSDTCFWLSFFSGLCIQNKFLVYSVFIESPREKPFSKDQQNCLLLLLLIPALGC